MAKFTNKIVRRFKKVERGYWDLTPQERFESIREMLMDFSPNDDVRNRKTKDKK